MMENNSISAAFGRISHVAAVRELFMSKMVYDPITKRPLPDVNNIFCTNFQDGLFRMVCVRLLYNSGSTRGHNQLSIFQERLLDIVQKRLGTLCYELLTEGRFMGFFLLLNYPLGADDDIIRALGEMLPETEREAALMGDHGVAICVGGAYSALKHAKLSKREVSSVSWQRRFKGKGGVFFYQGEKEYSKTVNSRFDALDRHMRGACDALSVHDFTKCMDEFFSMPEEIQDSEKSKAFLQDTKDCMFSANTEILSAIADVEQIYSAFEQQLFMCASLDEYKDKFIAQFADIVERISESKKERVHPSIDFAMSYIREHYSEEIDINIIAEYVNLSAAYFSALFKKETGDKFTEHLTRYRMSVAKRMLREGYDNIQEISLSVGFPDVRYFCKVFKKQVGCTPTAYRNRDGSAGENQEQ